MSAKRYRCTRPFSPAAGLGHTGQVEEAVIEAAGAELIRRVTTKERVSNDTPLYDWRLVESSTDKSDDDQDDMRAGTGPAKDTQ